MSYPKWLYHRTEKTVIANDPDEHAALGAGWEETPAAFKAEPEPEPELEPQPEPEPEAEIDLQPEPEPEAKRRGSKRSKE